MKAIRRNHTIDLFVFTALMAISLLCLPKSSASKEEENETKNTGVSISLHGKYNGRGKNTVSPFVFDQAFRHGTKGKVGRNGKKGNVSTITIYGINVPSAGGKGRRVADQYVVNETDNANVHWKPSKGPSPKVITGISTSFPYHDHRDKHLNRLQYSIGGMWVNFKDGNYRGPRIISRGLFVDGFVTGPDELAPNGKTYQGRLTSSAQECRDNCIDHVDATVTAVMSLVDKSLKLTTSETTVEEEKNNKEVTRTGPEYNLTGTLQYDRQSNTLSGNLTNSKGESGMAMGRYYGPAHTEFAIVYHFGESSNEKSRLGMLYGVRKP